MALLPADCLNEIFENLEKDKITLHSCLLVNRLWCEISVRILWRDIWKYKYSVSDEHKPQVVSAILSTLIACLPSESKELLHENGIFITTPTSNHCYLIMHHFAKFFQLMRLVEWLMKHLKINHLLLH